MEGDDCSLIEILTGQLFHEGLKKTTIDFSDDNRESAKIRSTHLSVGKVTKYWLDGPGIEYQ